MRIRRADEHARPQLLEPQVTRLGQILRHLLLDGAALVLPLLARGQYGAHAQRLDVQGQIQILGWHGASEISVANIGSRRASSIVPNSETARRCSWNA